MALKAFKINKNDVFREGSSKLNKTAVNLSNKLKNNKSRNLIYMPNNRTIKKLIFITPNAKNAFNYLKQMFIKALIF